MFLPLPMDLLFEEKKIYWSEAWRNSRLGSTGTRRRGGLPYESMAVLTKADKWWTETKIQRLQSSMGIGTRTGIRGSKCSAQYLFWRGHRRRPPPPSSRPSPRPSFSLLLCLILFCRSLLSLELKAVSGRDDGLGARPLYIEVASVAPDQPFTVHSFF